MRMHYAGASITGQAHLELAQKNQDSFSITNYNFGVVMVVADGLGTKKYSQIGSREVCKAVGEAAKIWSKKECAPIEILIKLIHNIWEISIYPYMKNECGTTCLFCIVLNNGKVILGQLGDGIICYKKGKYFCVLSEREDDFLNVTDSMSSVKNIYEWKFREFNLDNDDFTLLMTSDGLSEDIIVEKRSEFMFYIVEQIKLENKQTKKNLTLKKLLKNCEGQYSGDDKTLIIFTREVDNVE